MSQMSLRYITVAFSLGALLACKISAAPDAPRDWENPQLTGLNNEIPHATMIVCHGRRHRRAASAWHKNSERVKSPFYRSLNGQWKYHYSTNPAFSRVDDFWATDFRRCQMDNIPRAGRYADKLKANGISDLCQHPLSVDVAWHEARTPPSGAAGF